MSTSTVNVNLYSA